MRDAVGEGERRSADLEARRAAQTTFGRPLVLEAGAGTGKTSVLVARVLAWCLGDGWRKAEAALRARGGSFDDERVAARVLERVTAITFTEAAAAEMEQRIGRALRALATDRDAGLPRGLEPEALPARELWRPRASALLASFDRLRVSTIHAWCRRLLAEHPIEAGVHPRFAVDERGLRRAAAAREVVEAWLFEAGSREDPALVDLVASGVAAPELEQMLIALLAGAVSASAFAADPVAPDRIGALAARLREAIGRFVDAEAGRMAALPASAKGRKVSEAARRTRELLETARPADAASLEDLLAEIRERWEPVLGRLREWGEKPWAVDSERDAAGDRIAAISAAARGLAPLLGHACSLDPVRLERLHAALAPLLERAEERLRASGAESFDALLRRTRELLDKHPIVSARIRAGIDQLLVDEFQDTDPAQCAIIAELGLGDRRREPGEWPGLFAIGDPKQSIYGWRNADLAAYQSFCDRVEASGGELRGLCVNHRSSPAVLGEVARVMEEGMREERGLQPAFEDLLADPGREADLAPAIEYWISSSCDREAGALAWSPSRTVTEREAAHLACDLRRQAEAGGEAWRWERVGILLRSMADADVYLEALRRAEIPYVVGRDRTYYQRREVIEAAALARAVLDPGDQIALISTLRSAWVGVPDAAWRPLWEREFPDAVRGLLDGREDARERLERAVRAAAEVVRGQPIPGLERTEGWGESLLHALDVLAALRRSFERDRAERFLEKLRTLPLLDAVEGARFLGAWRLANLDRFFRELGSLLEESCGDPAPVLRALRRDASQDVDWDEGRSQHPTEDAVQVMTIHAAKGLEFEHVYLLQLHKGTDASRLDAFCGGREDLAGEWRLAAGGAHAETLGFDQVQTRRTRVAQAERVRALYVAMTRAARRLVLAGCWCRGKGRGAQVELIAEGRPEELRTALAEALRSERASVDVAAARFVFLDLASASERAPGPGRAPAAVDAGRARSDFDALLAARGRAGAGAARAFGGPVSEKAAEDLRESAVSLDAEDAAGRAVSRDSEVATLVGTAIHRFLDRFDWSAEPAAELARQRAWIREWLARNASPARAARASARADGILERLVGGALWPRLQAIAPRVVGRELPVLVRRDGESEGPVAYAAGAIDLVYRDADTGELVVVDFKTDEITGDAMLEERSERYRPQGRAYCKAIAEALRPERPPRFELWFLDRGCVVEPELEAGRRSVPG